MITNKILNLLFIKNLYINSLIDTINIVAYKKYFDSMNHLIRSKYNNKTYVSSKTFT